MKRLCILCFCIVWFSTVFVVHAQMVEQVVFLPKTYFVGDVVEARISLRMPLELRVTVPEELPANKYIDIQSVDVEQRVGGIEVSIIFQSFFVGIQQLPPIDLGSFTLDGISVVVSSILSKNDKTIEPIRDQLLLPGTRLLLAFFFIVLVSIPFLVIFAKIILKQQFQRIRKLYQQAYPYWRLQRRTRFLQTNKDAMSGKEYYTKLLGLIRSFLAQRFHIDIASATTQELKIKLADALITEEVSEQLIDLFQFGDMVRFANQWVSMRDRQQHLSNAIKLCTRVHKKRR